LPKAELLLPVSNSAGIIILIGFANTLKKRYVSAENKGKGGHIANLFAYAVSRFEIKEVIE